MSTIEDGQAQLDEAKQLAEEAQDLASQAKEKGAEALDKLLNVSGPNMGDTAAIAFSMLREAGEQIEQGQALLLSAQDALDNYKTALGQ